MKKLLIGLFVLSSLSAFATETEECRSAVINTIKDIPQVHTSVDGYNQRSIEFSKAGYHELSLDSTKAGLRLEDKIQAVARQVCP